MSYYSLLAILTHYIPLCFFQATFSSGPIKRGSHIHLAVDMENHGYAAPYRAKDVLILMHDSSMDFG